MTPKGFPVYQAFLLIILVIGIGLFPLGAVTGKSGDFILGCITIALSVGLLVDYRKDLKEVRTKEQKGE